MQLAELAMVQQVLTTSTNPVIGHKAQNGEEDFCVHPEKQNKVSEPFKKKKSLLIVGWAPLECHKPVQ